MTIDPTTSRSVRTNCDNHQNNVRRHSTHLALLLSLNPRSIGFERSVFAALHSDGPPAAAAAAAAFLSRRVGPPRLAHRSALAHAASAVPVAVHRERGGDAVSVDRLAAAARSDDGRAAVAARSALLEGAADTRLAVRHESADQVRQVRTNHKGLLLITQTYGNTTIGWRRLILSYTYVWPHQWPASWFS